MEARVLSDWRKSLLYALQKVELERSTTRSPNPPPTPATEALVLIDDRFEQTRTAEATENTPSAGRPLLQQGLDMAATKGCHTYQHRLAISQEACQNLAVEQSRASHAPFRREPPIKRSLAITAAYIRGRRLKEEQQPAEPEKGRRHPRDLEYRIFTLIDPYDSYNHSLTCLLEMQQDEVVGGMYTSIHLSLKAQDPSYNRSRDNVWRLFYTHTRDLHDGVWNTHAEDYPGDWSHVTLVSRLKMTLNPPEARCIIIADLVIPWVVCLDHFKVLKQEVDALRTNGAGVENNMARLQSDEMGRPHAAYWCERNENFLSLPDDDDPEWQKIWARFRGIEGRVVVRFEMYRCISLLTANINAICALVVEDSGRWGRDLGVLRRLQEVEADFEVYGEEELFEDQTNSEPVDEPRGGGNDDWPEDDKENRDPNVGAGGGGRRGADDNGSDDGDQDDTNMNDDSDEEDGDEEANEEGTDNMETEEDASAEPREPEQMEMMEEEPQVELSRELHQGQTETSRETLIPDADGDIDMGM